MIRVYLLNGHTAQVHSCSFGSLACFGVASLDTWWLLKCLLYEWRETQRISDRLE